MLSQEIERAIDSSAQQLIFSTEDISKGTTSAAARRSNKAAPAGTSPAASVKVFSGAELFYDAAKRFEAERAKIEGTRPILEVMCGGAQRLDKDDQEQQYIMLGRKNTPVGAKKKHYIEEEAREGVMSKEEVKKDEARGVNARAVEMTTARNMEEGDPIALH